jgi:hypothetical protein
VTEPELTRPTLRIVRGEPSAEELAALTALMAAAGSDEGDTPPPPPVRGRWNDPAAGVRRAWPAGPGGWLAAR